MLFNLNEHMHQDQIQIATQEEAMEICEHLKAFNVSVIGEYRFDPVWLVHRGKNDDVLGGVVGEIVFGWLNISVLWVADNHRGTGLGSALLKAAEQLALERGARHVQLDTFDWQAADFYMKRGYTEFARLNDCPPGRERAFMRKQLR
jgi:GNAT superfamily N-acetyltransferase